MLNQKSAIAANRFGLGARPGDAGRIGDDPAGWLEQQLAPASSGGRPRGRPASAAVLTEVSELRLARQAAQSRIRNEAPEVDPGAVREFGRFIADSYQTQANAGLAAAIASETPFQERLVGFWSNHFAVSADKQPVGAIAGHYRDEAIRPHVSGSFREMLQAAVAHPAMLLYLDNQTSIGPNSLQGSRANRGNRTAGLNENLAREILELHTLGVDGGYTQDDVIEFSRSLTGWSIGGPGDGNAARMAAVRRPGLAGDTGAPGEFSFRAAVHEPGSKTILGRRFREDGVDEARAVLDFLATRPETARFVATKLARHFVADEPPPALVDSLAATYLDHDTALTPVYHALVRADASWREPLAKHKTPEDFVVSTYRALGIAAPANQLLAVTTQLGQRPMTPGSPAGWPDIAEQWNGGDALLKRIEWATTVGRSVGDRIDAPARVDEVLGVTAGTATRNAIRRAESGAQAIALLVSAPEFQRR